MLLRRRSANLRISCAVATALAIARPSPAPAAFLENHGQMRSEVRFHSLGGRLGLVVTEGGAVICVRAGEGEEAARFTLGLPVSSGVSRMEGGEPSSTRIHLYRGAQAFHPGLFEAVRIEVRKEDSAPASSPSWLEIRCDGNEISYRWTDGPARGPLACAEAGRLALVHHYDEARGAGVVGPAQGGGEGAPIAGGPGVPPLLWSTLLGGAGGESGRGDIVMDGAGRMFVTGATSSFDFPVVPGAPDSVFGGVRDAFIACVDSSGSALVWCTFLGGAGWDEGEGLTLGAGATVLAAGFTESADFPFTAGSFDSTFGGVRDAWVARLQRDSGALLWSTYLGGSDWDEARALAQAGDRPCVAGITWSADFPWTPGSFDSTYAGGGDMFAGKLVAGGDSLLWASYLGGTDFDQANAVLAESGNLIVGGETHSSAFPHRGDTFDTTYADLGDGAIVKLNAVGNTLLWGAFLGGSDWDAVTCLTAGPGTELTLGGFSWSMDFPAGGPCYDLTYNGGGDGFAAQIPSDASGLPWATFLGGSLNDVCRDIAVQSDGRITLAGDTRSGNFPITAGAYDPGFNGQYDVFVTRLTPGAGALEWSSFLGGSGGESALAFAMDEDARVGLCGWTRSAGFPVTSGAFDSTYSGESDAFVLLLDIGALTSVASASPPLPRGPALRVAPNPASGSARIEFTLSSRQHVQVDVLDARGRRVRMLFAGARGPGMESAQWDGGDAGGRRVAPGIYFARVASNEGASVEKILLIR